MFNLPTTINRNRIIDWFFPNDSIRRIVVRSIYLQILRKKKVRIVVDRDIDFSTNTVTQSNDSYMADLFVGSYEKSPDYVPYEHSNFKFEEDDVKLIAFYLPQYHPFPENEQFWGKGFTEWSNVTKAVPVFRGHYQPRLPDELGYYDLRIKDIMMRQIELAKEYGIYGFCFHHYWFSGKPVMRIPYNHLISNHDLNIPFCLHWANEPWTARFDGYNKNGVLLDQVHSPDDDIAFIQDIETALRDKRYIRINGRPLLIVYRHSLFPDIRRTIERWNKFSEDKGLGRLYLAIMQTGFEGQVDPREYGFDAAIEFPPHLGNVNDIKSRMQLFYPEFSGYIFNYPDIVESLTRRQKPEYTLFRGIMPDWDCTARRINPSIFINSTPKLYQKWLSLLIQYTNRNLPPESRFIFINAWNEWAEGAYLEPDKKYGYAYLQATANAF